MSIPRKGIVIENNILLKIIKKKLGVPIKIKMEIFYYLFMCQENKFMGVIRMIKEQHLTQKKEEY